VLDFVEAAKMAYVAYEATMRRNRAFRGEILPLWDKLPPTMRKAWVDAVKAAFGYFLHPAVPK